MEAVFEKENLVKEYKSAITPKLIKKTLADMLEKNFKNLSSSNEPVFKIISGPCGMGKTTLTNKILQKSPNYVWLNSDSIRFILDDNIFSGEIRRQHPDLLSGIFSDLARNLREELGLAALASNFNIILDCVLIKPEICQNLLLPAQKKGYEISANILTGNIMTGITRIFNRYTRQVAETGLGHMIIPQWQQEVMKMFLEDTAKFLHNIPLSNVTLITEDEEEISFSKKEIDKVMPIIQEQCTSPLRKSQKEKLLPIWEDSFRSLKKITVSEEIKNLYDSTYRKFLEN